MTKIIFYLSVFTISSLFGFDSTDPVLTRKVVDPFLNCAMGELDENGNLSQYSRGTRVIIAKSSSFFSKKYYLVLGSGGTAGALEDIGEISKIMRVSVAKRTDEIRLYTNKKEDITFLSMDINPGLGLSKALLIKEDQEIKMVCTYPIVEEGGYGTLMRALINYKRSN